MPADRRRAVAAFFAVSLVLLQPWGSLAGHWVHIDDGLALAAMSVAVAATARRRPWLAAVAVGAAVAFKPWAIVALPLLVGLPRHRRGAVLVALSVVAVSWLPFFLADPSTAAAAARPFPVDAGAPVHVLGLHSAYAPHWLRSVQLLGALAAALAVGRRRGWQWTLAAGMLGRLLLDPATFDYYTAGALIALAVSERAGGRLPIRTVICYLGLWLPGVAVEDGATLGAVRLLVLAILLLDLAVPEAAAAVRRAVAVRLAGAAGRAAAAPSPAA